MVRSLLLAVALWGVLGAAALADPTSQDPAKVPAGDYALPWF